MIRIDERTGGRLAVGQEHVAVLFASTATAEQLDALTARILTAADLGELFG